MSSESVAENTIEVAFSHFDKDSTGFLSISDLGNLLELLGETVSPEELADIAHELDPNNHGNFGYNEFETAFLSLQEKEIIEAFLILDKDKDGYISRTDLRAFLANTNEKLADDEVDDMISAAAVDGENVNYEDFFMVFKNVM